MTPRCRKVVFLDRDGSINKKMPEGDYVKKWAEFEFLPGAKEALGLLSRNGYEIFIITNQRGIARGLMSEKDLHDIHENMKEELGRENIEIKGIYYCPHEKDVCDCRKPKPGMLIKAAGDYDIKLDEAVMIGDGDSDIEAGKAAGCRTVKLEKGETLLGVVSKLIE